MQEVKYSIKPSLGGCYLFVYLFIACLYLDYLTVFK